MAHTPTAGDLASGCWLAGSEVLGIDMGDVTGDHEHPTLPQRSWEMEGEVSAVAGTITYTVAPAAGPSRRSPWWSTWLQAHADWVAQSTLGLALPGVPPIATGPGCTTVATSTAQQQRVVVIFQFDTADGVARAAEAWPLRRLPLVDFHRRVLACPTLSSLMFHRTKVASSRRGVTTTLYVYGVKQSPDAAFGALDKVAAIVQEARRVDDVDDADDDASWGETPWSTGLMEATKRLVVRGAVRAVSQVAEAAAEAAMDVLLAS